MSEANKSMPKFDLICEYYSSMERQVPDSPGQTAKALSYIDNLACQSKIVDIGCGTAGQTGELHAANDFLKNVKKPRAFSMQSPNHSPPA